MNSLTTYANGTVAELPNKKISIEDCEGTFVIEIKNVGKEFSQPCVIHDFKEEVSNYVQNVQCGACERGIIMRSKRF